MRTTMDNNLYPCEETWKIQGGGKVTPPAQKGGDGGKTALLPHSLKAWHQLTSSFIYRNWTLLERLVNHVRGASKSDCAKYIWIQKVQIAKRILYICSRDPLKQHLQTSIDKRRQINVGKNSTHQHIYPHSQWYSLEHTTRIYVVWHLMPKSMKTLNKYICYLKQDFKIVVH